MAKQQTRTRSLLYTFWICCCRMYVWRTRRVAPRLNTKEWELSKREQQTNQSAAAGERRKRCERVNNNQTSCVISFIKCQMFAGAGTGGGAFRRLFRRVVQHLISMSHRIRTESVVAVWQRRTVLALYVDGRRRLGCWQVSDSRRTRLRRRRTRVCTASLLLLLQSCSQSSAGQTS